MAMAYFLNCDRRSEWIWGCWSAEIPSLLVSPFYFIAADKSESRRIWMVFVVCIFGAAGRTPEPGRIEPNHLRAQPSLTRPPVPAHSVAVPPLLAAGEGTINSPGTRRGLTSRDSKQPLMQVLMQCNSSSGRGEPFPPTTASDDTCCWARPRSVCRRPSTPCSAAAWQTPGKHSLGCNLLHRIIHVCAEA